MLPSGSTRSCVQRNYALLTPDTFVPGATPGWSNAICHTHITASLGASFTQRTILLGQEGKGIFHSSLMQRFFYVLEGTVSIRCGHQSRELSASGYAYVPAGQGCEIHAVAELVKLAVFEKSYESLESLSAPDPVFGVASEKSAEPFLGDPHAMLKLLLPDTPAWDMAVNLFTYQPGARLPMVEVHVMEHGLLMLEGEGIYRLGSDWHPVQAGDVIWMGPFCPQWFGALGKTPASYLYYKDINRHALH